MSDSTSAIITFVEQYIDVNESVALELQSRVTDYLNMDMEHRPSIDKAFSHARDLCNRSTGGSHVNIMDSATRKRNLRQLTHLLMRMQEMGDERLRLVEGAQDMIDAKRRCIDASRRRLDAGLVEEGSGRRASSREEEESRDTGENMSEVGSVATASRKSSSTLAACASRKKERGTGKGASSTTSKRSGVSTTATPSQRQRSSTSLATNPSNSARRRTPAGNKGRGQRKAGGGPDLTNSQSKPEVTGAYDRANDDEDPGSPDPLYCLCQQISFGEMIACDNDSCSIEWFHFGCVNVHSRPKGRWYCPKCRGESAKLKRPDA